MVLTVRWDVWVIGRGHIRRSLRRSTFPTARIGPERSEISGGESRSAPAPAGGLQVLRVVQSDSLDPSREHFGVKLLGAKLIGVCAGWNFQEPRSRSERAVSQFSRSRGKGSEKRQGDAMPRLRIWSASTAEESPGKGPL